jgi:hypothetical protein
MFTNPLRASRLVLLALLVAALAALAASPAGAHPDAPHFSFDTLQLLGAGPAEQPAESGAVRVPGAARARAIPVVGGGETKVECFGNGTQGKRVQVMYVRDVDTPDGFATWKASIGAWAVGGDRIFRDSAAKTSGSHRIRFVHDEYCNLSILDVVVDDVDDLAGDDLDPLKDLVDALGYDGPNRKYLMFVDNATAMCGRGTRKNDDSPGQDNISNGLPNGEAGYVRIDFDKGNCNPEDWIVAHELSHNLGAVQLTAPNSNGQGHCIDDGDRLCQDDGTGLLTTVCTAADAEVQLDCNNDDYFHTNPPAGTYLDTNWNIANSDFLQAEPGDLWAFVRGNDAAAASYTPSADYQQNSTFATNTIVRTARGVYEVAFPNLAVYGSNSGSALVTAYGTAGEHCKPSKWEAAGGPDNILTVRCYDAAGATVDAQFDASFIRPTAVTGSFAYLLADDESNPAPYTPSLPHQFSSSGLNGTVDRNGAGDYEVTLPSVGSTDGTVKVTAFGGGSTYCKAASWSTVGADEVVDVLCFDAAGTAVDNDFLLVYADDLSVLANERDNGYVLANDAGAALGSAYTPASTERHNSDGGTNTVTRDGVGLYTVTLPGLGNGGFAAANRGTVHATASHTTSKRCEVTSWSSTVPVFGGTSDLVAHVACHTAAGVASNAKFVLQFTE